MTKGDLTWRWVVRLAGLTGLVYGAAVDQTLPDTYLLVFAAMIGLDQFVGKVSGK